MCLLFYVQSGTRLTPIAGPRPIEITQGPPTTTQVRLVQYRFI